jgi:uncharacterized protein (UPF0548 family)
MSESRTSPFRVMLRAPDEGEILRFLEAARRATFSYPERGATRVDPPPGYDHDHNRVRLGAGRETFERARGALHRWAMFPPGWTRVANGGAPIAEGETVSIVFHVLGAWWLNACRIVYVQEESEPLRCSGFAYGTLACHVERGEERFRVEWLSDDSVWYDVLAFSRPEFWGARLAKPLARALQRRFVRDSQAAMRAAVSPSR